MSLRVEDHFCGAGGSTTGAEQVDGVEVVHAANHDKVAIATHSGNYPHIEHSLADIPTMDPRRVPAADILITSPECKAHSYARGRPKDDPSLFDPNGDKGAERSRATMWEVPRFAEARRYKAIVVENVPQVLDWCERTETGHTEKCKCGQSFRDWLAEMAKLGYVHRKLFLNSSFFPPTPQSRDRVYIVFWRRDQRTPDLDFHPIAWCPECSELVGAEQAMKPHLRMPPQVRLSWSQHDRVWGRYEAQYLYWCPSCGHRAQPAITPAATAIEWDRPAVRIGDRDRALAPGTMARIQKGLERLRDRPFVVGLDYLSKGGPRARSVDDVLATITAQHRMGLVVQVGGNLGRLNADGSIDRAAGNKVWTTDEPLRTIHGTLDRGLVLSNMAHNVPRLSDSEAMATVTTGGKLGLVVPYREFGTAKLADSEPLQTLTTITSLYTLGLPEAVVMADRKHTLAARVEADALHTICAGGNHHFLVQAGGPDRDDARDRAAAEHDPHPRDDGPGDRQLRLVQGPGQQAGLG